MASSSQQHLLKPDELRLLKFNRQPSEENPETLHFQLDTYTRTGAPRYTAISYTWGEQPTSRQILIDGQPTNISSNLWWCLFNLCHHTDWAYVWVDALCINQKDDLEKSGQVREMAATFRDAKLVAAWLGRERECDGEEDRTEMAMIERTASADDAAVRSWSWEDELPQLCRRRYWTRRWIAQELFRARKIEVFCGQHRLPWTGFDSLLDQQDQEEAAGWDGPTTMRRLLKGSQSVTNALEIFINLRHLECKEEHDRIYALLSLFPTEYRKSLLPSYADTYRKVVTQFLALIIYDKGWETVERHANELGEAFGLGPTEFWGSLHGVEMRRKSKEALEFFRNLY